MKRHYRWLLLSTAVLVAAGLAMVNRHALPVASAQQDDPTAYKWLYENDELFNQLSGAARTGLEVRFGRKGKGGIGRPLSPKTPGSGEHGSGRSSPVQGGAEPLSSLGNPLVNDPTADLTTQDTQSETALVLGSGSNVVSAFNDSGSFIAGARKFTGYSLSTDGSASWADKGTLPSGSDGDLGDPVLARSGSTGTVFLATLSFNTRQNILIFRSTDNGATFLPPVNGSPGFVFGTDAQDKEWIAADNFAGPGQGNVYLVWRDFSFTSRNNIYFSRSTDDGLTWGPSLGTTIDTFGQGAFVTVGPDHSVYVFWWNANSFPARITMRKSTDQGATFGPITTVASLLGFTANGDLGLNGGFRTNSFPQVVVNPLNGNIYCVYNDRTSGLDRANIFLTQSTDGGSTWSAAVTVNDDGTLNDQYMPAMSITPDGTRLSITFYDRRRDPLNSLIDRFGVIGSISGSTVSFGPNFLITSQSFPVVRGVDPVINFSYMGDYDMMAADDSFFYTTWGDNRDKSIAAPFRNNANVRSAKIPVAGPGAILTLAGTALPTSGNGNGAIDANECNNLNVTIRNFGTSTATGVSAVLSTSTPGVSVFQAISTYPDIPIGNKGTNTTPFQISTSPLFPCGTPISFILTVASSDGTSTIPFQMATATPLPPVRFNNNTPVPIPDLSTAESSITVSGISAPISAVTVSLFIAHTFDNDLVVQLVGPGGTTVDLSNRHGSNGLNYGVACTPDTSRTTFDDGALIPISSGSAPFIGSFRPDQALSAFAGKTGLDVNGVWKLKVSDVEAGDTGAIQCWSLTITPVACADGGGTCSAFLDFASATLSDNGNGLVDPNECFELNVALRNSGIATANALTAVLSSNTAEVNVIQQASVYPDIPTSGTGTNSTPFKLITTAAFRCGTPVKLSLTVTATQGKFIIPISLVSGIPGSTSVFASTDVPKPIPDGDLTGVDSAVTVSGITGSINKVTVSLHITHSFVGDLDFFLVGPDGTTIVLSSGNGGGGFNYGISCANRTIFDDSAGASILQAFAPFLGTFRPEEPLSRFIGKSGSAANGTWKLHLVDRLGDFQGTLQCWSLTISQISCIDGGAVSISPTSQSFTPSGGTGLVNVTAQTGCIWTATATQSWITITSGSSGTGNGTVGYSVAANAACPRTGAIIISGNVFTVTQEGLTCTFTIDPPSVNFGPGFGVGSVAVTTSASCCTWTATSNVRWITVTSGSSGTGNGTVTFSVTFNSGTARSGTITIAGLTFTVNQAGIAGTDTIGLFNPATSTFSLRNSNTSGVADVTFAFGPAGAGWKPIVGDWNGDGIDTVGLFNPATSTFFLKNSHSGGAADITFAFGPPGAGWIPIAGDWNGDGIDTVGLFNPATSTFFLRNSNTSGVADITFAFGPAAAGWLPIVGDWNGNFVDTVGLFNPATSTFFLKNTHSGGGADITFSFGPPGAGWKPIAGDWNSDVVETVGLFNPATSTFFLRNFLAGGAADLTFGYGPAAAGWTPLAGDWDGL